MENQRIKVIYIISFIDKALIYEWTAAHFAKSSHFDVKYLLMNPGETRLSAFLKDHQIPYKNIKYDGKKNFLPALFKIRKFLKKEKPDIVCTHLIDASLIGQIAAFFAGIKRRIHARHYATIHHVYHRQGLMYDKIINSISTHIMVATQMVKKILTEKEKVAPEKVTVINYGFDLNQFIEVNAERVNALKKKYNPRNGSPVIGVISRFLHWKGVQYIIPAFKKLLTDFPDAHLILANAKGNYASEIRKMLEGIPEEKFTVIPFESDSPALYRLFDYIVHVPVSYHAEAFGQVYVESLASGIPGVFTISGIANDFIRHKENAWVVPYKDSAAICEGLKALSSDTMLKEKIIRQGKADVMERFQFSEMIRKTELFFLES